MDLKRLERVWSGLGRRDPYWAALTRPDKANGRWSSEEFFRTGEDEIAEVLRRAAEKGWRPGRSRALDFGCGAGRLSQALASRFDRVDGVDISRPMLALARRHNRYPGRCLYHHNPGPMLDAFDDHTFDLVYSVLTLQHIPPEYSGGYIGELVRVLAPGGLLVFQLPSHRGAREPDAATTHTVATARLSRSAFAAAVSIEHPCGSMQAGEHRLLGVTVRNTGDRLWPSGARDDGLYRVQVGNQWRTADGATTLSANDGRVPLPHDLAPGADAHVLLEVTAPATDGDYELRVDLVQEHVAWFHERGSKPATVPCRIEGGKPATARVAPAARFAARHPRFHAALVRLGLDVVRGGFRRRVNRARTARWQRAAMVMYCLPEREVKAIVRAAGGRLFDVEHDRLPSGFESCRYWATRP